MRSLSKLVVCLSIIYWTVGCSTPGQQHSESQRGIAADDPTSEYETAFMRFFENTQARTKGIQGQSAEGAEGDLRTQQESLQKALTRTYYFLYEYDKELDRIVDACNRLRQSQPDAECTRPTDLKEYRALQAYRQINENIRHKLTYYYLRLLDLANASDETNRPIFQASSHQLSLLSSEESMTTSADARGMLTSWNQWIAEAETKAIGLDVMGKLVMDEMRVLRDRALLTHSRVSGKVPPSNLTLDLDVRSFYETNRSKIQDVAYQSAASQDPAVVKEALSQQPQREPNAAAFLNHNGSSFPRGTWAVTYDDGPSSSNTNQILDLYAKYGYKTTFFWLAQNASSSGNRAVIQRAKSLGMGLAHHSYTHANLGKSGANLKREIIDAKNVLESIYGVSVNYFRLPYGSGVGNANVKNVIANAGLEHFFWNVDSLDWQDPSPESTYQRVLKQMSAQGRGIILFHDIHARTVQTTAKLLSYFKSNPSLRIVQLTAGLGGIQKPANGSAVAPRPEVVEQVPQTYPHYRRIITNNLNVRNVPRSTDSAPCGSYEQSRVVQVLGADPATGWFRVNTNKDLPNPPEGQSQHLCQPEAFISNGVSYSLPEKIL